MHFPFLSSFTCQTRLMPQLDVYIPKVYEAHWERPTSWIGLASQYQGYACILGWAFGCALEAIANCHHSHSFAWVGLQVSTQSPLLALCLNKVTYVVFKLLIVLIFWAWRILECLQVLFITLPIVGPHLHPHQINLLNNKLGEYLAHEFDCFLFFLLFLFKFCYWGMGDGLWRSLIVGKYLLLQLNLRKSWSAWSMQSESINSPCMHLVYFVKM